MASRKNKWRYRIQCRIQCRIPYRIRYLSVKLRQCAVRQFPFLFEHLTAVTKMGIDLGTAMMNEISGISSPHLRAPCNTILHLGIRLPAFFVMCQTGVFWIKRLSISNQSAASSIARSWSAGYIDPGRNKGKKPPNQLYYLRHCIRYRMRYV